MLPSKRSWLHFSWPTLYDCERWGDSFSAICMQSSGGARTSRPWGRSSGANVSTVKEPGHFEVRKSSRSQVTGCTYFLKSWRSLFLCYRPFVSAPEEAKGIGRIFAAVMHSFLTSNGVVVNFFVIILINHPAFLILPAKLKTWVLPLSMSSLPPKLSPPNFPKLTINPRIRGFAFMRYIRGSSHK